MPRHPSVTRHLRSIHRTLSDIETAFASLAKRARRGEHEMARKLRPRRKLTITRKRRAQLKLQGAYMGYMRQLKPRVKAQVKAIKEKRGFEAAIRVAKRLSR